MEGALVNARMEDATVRIAATTGADGSYSFQIQAFSLPVRVLVEASITLDGLPEVQNSRWYTVESYGSFPVEPVLLPAVSAAEFQVTEGTARNGDDSILVEGLPEEVDRLFANSYDPDEEPEVFPGEFAENGQIPLNSSLFLWMAALDAQGNPVSDLAQAVTIRSIIPRSQWSDLADIFAGTDRIEIPIYTFNEETDLWEQEEELGWLEDGDGTVLPEDAQSVILDGSFSGVLYATMVVNHFSWMNVDYAFIGPWTLSRLSRDRRNVDCLFQALQLSKTIVKSQKGRTAYAKVNRVDADISAELADGAGPEITAEELEGANGSYHGDSGGREDEFKVDSEFWDQCSDGATEEQKKNAIMMLVQTILHETAHLEGRQQKVCQRRRRQ